MRTASSSIDLSPLEQQTSIGDKRSRFCRPGRQVGRSLELVERGIHRWSNIEPLSTPDTLGLANGFHNAL